MPTVPRRDQSLVQPTGRVPVGIPADAIGVANNQPDLSGFGKEFAELAQRARQKADYTALLDADNQLSKLSTDLTTRAQQRRGRDAMGAMDEAQQGWDQGVSQIESSLATDQQRLAFSARASQHHEQLYGAVETHAAREADAYQAQTTEDALKLRVTGAVQNFEQPNAIATSLAESRAILADFGKQRGWSPETIAQNQSEWATRIHSGVIAQMIAKGNDLAARDYFTAHKGEIGAEQLPELAARVDVASTDGQAMRVVDGIWAKQGPRTLNDPARVSTMEQAIRDQYGADPKVAKAAIAELRSRVAAFNAEQGETTAANKAKLWSAFDQGTPVSALVRSPVYLSLSGTEQVALKNSMLDLQAHGEAREDSEAARRGYARYWELSQPDILARMSENEILAFRGQLGRSLTNQLMTQKRTLTRADGARAATIDADQFNQIANEAGLNPYATSSPRIKATLGQLRNAVETEIARRQTAGGKALDRDQKAAVMQGIVDTHVMQESFGPDNSVIAATVQQSDLGNVYVPIAKVPSSAALEYVNYLRSVGVAIDSDNAAVLARFQSRIEHAYAARMAGATDRQIQNLLRGRNLNQ